jgi:integrase
VTTKWTATSLDKLPPGEYTDPAVRGLQVRVRRAYGKRAHSWLFRYKWQGKPVRIALAAGTSSLADARDLAIAYRKLIDRGIDPRTAERPNRRAAAPAPTPADPELAAALGNPHSVASLAREYLEKHVRRQRKRPEYVERFLDAEVLPADKWGSRDARTITPREVVELLDGIAERGSPTMANRGAGILSQMFRFGVHRALVDASPVQLLYRPGGKEKPRERALSEAELGAFLANLEGALLDRQDTRRVAPVLRLLLLTGQRRGELALARWRDVTLDGEAPVWRIPAEHSKTGAPHTVPLSPAAVAQFRALKKLAGSSVYVFPTEDGKAAADPKLITRSVARNLKRFTTAAAKLDPPVTLEPFTVHDLRRTCRTGLARLKVSHDVAERVLNHKLPAMRAVYDQHEPLEEMRAALVKWAEHLAELEAGAARAAK